MEGVGGRVGRSGMRGRGGISIADHRDGGGRVVGIAHAGFPSFYFRIRYPTSQSSSSFFSFSFLSLTGERENPIAKLLGRRVNAGGGEIEETHSTSVITVINLLIRTR